MEFQIKLHILLVEDNPGDVRLIEEFFNESVMHESKITEVSTIEAALKMLQLKKFDLILTDLGLPDKSGIGTFLTLNNAAPEIPIIVLTGNEDDEVSLEAVSMGAQDYLIKNRLDSHMLIKSINHSLQRKQILQKLSEREDQLEKLNIQKDKFFSIIAHDLKSPIAALKSISEYCLNEFNQMSRDELLETVKMLDDCSDNIYKLVDNLLEWSRVQSGRVAFKPEKVDLCSLVKGVIQLSYAGSMNKNIAIESECRGTLSVLVDINMIETVFRNLLSNAIKFSHPDSKIIIYGERINDIIQIRIVDQGIGMSQNILNKLFKIEENVTRSGTNNEEGTGLGLILVKEFIEKNNGNIRVESEEGKGTVFIFQLPAYDIS